MAAWTNLLNHICRNTYNQASESLQGAVSGASKEGNKGNLSPPSHPSASFAQ